MNIHGKALLHVFTVECFAFRANTRYFKFADIRQVHEIRLCCHILLWARGMALSCQIWYATSLGSTVHNKTRHGTQNSTKAEEHNACTRQRWRVGEGAQRGFLKTDRSHVQSQWAMSSRGNSLMSDIAMAEIKSERDIQRVGMQRERARRMIFRRWALICIAYRINVNIKRISNAFVYCQTQNIYHCVCKCTLTNYKIHLLSLITPHIFLKIV